VKTNRNEKRQKFTQPKKSKAGLYSIVGVVVCNVCGTTWDLQILKGINGGCQTYPLEALTYSLNGDNLEIPQTILDTWAPRV